MIGHLIRKFLLCVLCLVALLLPVEALRRQVPNNYSFKKDYFDHYAGRIKTLILGSSHSYFGLDPDVMQPGAFNAAYYSQSLNYDFAILRKYEKGLDSLRTIIVPVSYTSLFQTVDQGLEHWRLKNYRLYYDISFSGNPLYMAELLHLNRPVWKTIFQYYRYGQSLVTCSPSGFGTENGYKTEEAFDHSGEIAAARHTVSDYGRLPKIRTYLNGIMTIARRKQCKVILFTPPGEAAYRKHLNPAQLDLMRREVGELVRRNRDIAVYQDLLSDADFMRTDYFDADHLNRRGALKLSRKMDSLIIASRAL